MEEFNLNDYITADDTLDIQLLYKRMSEITGFMRKDRQEQMYAYVTLRFSERHQERS